MDYKKKYKEALERAREYHKVDYDNTLRLYARGTMEYIFPELKESEDVKIKESLMQYIWDIYHREYCPPTPSIETCDKWLSWLEKQGEQKPTWNEEDETALCDALWCCKQAASIAKDENDMGNIWYAEKWIKSLKDRMKGE